MRLIALVVILSLSAAAQAPIVAAKAMGPPAAKVWTAPRTADGHPDLEGIWTNATLTPLERPRDLAGKEFLTEQEAAAREKRLLEELSTDRRDGGAEADVGRSYNELWRERGKVLQRTSLIIDPPDGKIPPLTDAARQRTSGALRAFTRYDSVKDRPLSERCIIGFGSTSGPPMLPVLYNNNYEIVQTPNAVMILVEMVHDIRVIRINGTHQPTGVRQLLGDSIGHWEGDTLVADTTNFTDKTRFRGSSENLHVIERFRRVDSHTILYRATVDDPATFTKPWTLEYPFLATAGPVYEYACHEGNYAMPDILGGARKLETEAGHK